MRMRLSLFIAAWLAVLIINLAGSAIRFAYEVGMETVIMSALFFVLFRLSDFRTKDKLSKPAKWMVWKNLPPDQPPASPSPAKRTRSVLYD